MITEEILADILAGLQGRATDAQQQELMAWLDGSDDRRREYEVFCRMYYKLNYAAQWDGIDKKSALAKLNIRMKRKKRVRISFYLVSGVAALFLLFFAVSLFMPRPEIAVDENAVARQIIEPGEKKAVLTLADGKQVPLLGGKTMAVDLGSATVVDDSVSGLVYKFKDSGDHKLEYNTLSVPRGGEYIMTLSDGTRVWLNSDTELKYPVVFGQGTREVFVSGEAFFDVAGDAARPFIVTTSSTKTIVKGTAFNVMAYKDEDQTEITLVRGAVLVKAGQDSRAIVPGRQVCVDNRSLKLTERGVNVSFYTSWKDGIFDFDGMSLSDLTVKLSRWYDVNFFFVNGEAGSGKFTGAVKRNNTLDFMLRFIEKSSDVRFERKDKVINIYSK